MSIRNLDPWFDPASVAVFGASRRLALARELGRLQRQPQHVGRKHDICLTLQPDAVGAEAVLP